VQKSAALAANIGNVRNKYLDRAFELMGSAFPFFAMAVGVDGEGVRTVAHIGLDYNKLESASAAPVMVALALASASTVFYTRASTQAASAPAEAEEVHTAPVKPTPPKKATPPVKKKPAKKVTRKK
jgi:phosphatidylserine/phosphatidylglycerophosphate/cardiolipin synthase-like enzyme